MMKTAPCERGNHNACPIGFSWCDCDCHSPVAHKEPMMTDSKEQGKLYHYGYRPSWDEYFLAIAKTVSDRATCDRAHVGVVIVDEHHRIISTGYNGSPPGQPHCDDVGHLMEDDHCQRTIHAEVNAVAAAASAGVAVQDARMYMWVSRGLEPPCRECDKVLAAARIAFVVSATDDSDWVRTRPMSSLAESL